MSTRARKLSVSWPGERERRRGTLSRETSTRYAESAWPEAASLVTSNTVPVDGLARESWRCRPTIVR